MSRRSIRRKDKVYSSPVFLIIIGVLAALLSIPFLSGASDWPAEAVPAEAEPAPKSGSSAHRPATVRVETAVALEITFHQKTTAK